MQKKAAALKKQKRDLGGGMKTEIELNLSIVHLDMNKPKAPYTVQ
jgi:hypothetical protein